MDSESYYKKQLGTKLNRDKVKLWEPPFTQSDGELGEIPADVVAKYATEINIGEEEDVVAKYSTEMNIGEDEVKSLLATLRLHAVQKLAERAKFQKSGKATLKIKKAGRLGQAQRKVNSLEIELTSLGKDLRQQVAQNLYQPPDKLKLISAGRVINDNYVLQEQGVKNGSQIMVICLSLSESDAQAEDQTSLEFQDTRKAAEFISSKAGKGEEVEGLEMQITDQTGKPVPMPLHEKKALTLAMTLHEKGRQALKKKNVSLALPLLLDADNEFRQCSSDILNVVDNYAILCLDIVWCYLCLQNIEDLPNAADRLSSSESFFHKSYGSNLERLMTVKGSDGEELALFMRLHLMQGIVAFHQNKLDDSRRLLAKAQQELQRLHVDEEMLTTVMAMGFEEYEARLGLRACNGNVHNALAHIMKRREEKKENAKKRKEEHKRKEMEQWLGKCANGERVNVYRYEILVNMSYPKGAAAEALRQSNNDINLALEVIQNHPEFLSLPDPEPKPEIHIYIHITDGMIAQITSMGFEPEMAWRALTKHKGDIPKSIDELVKSGGFLPPPPESPGTSSGSSAANTPSDESPEELARSKERVKKLVEDMPENEEDYLDVRLEEETQFLTEYMSLVNSLKQ